MTGPVFGDTNAFGYRHDLSGPAKQALARREIGLLVRTRPDPLSYQVLQELYAPLTRSRGQSFGRSGARDIVEALSVWRPIEIDRAILHRAWLAEERYQISWWDLLIVAAAQVCACQILFTEDLQDGQVFDGVRVVDPFASPSRRPRQVLETLS